jgi:hypothetical protein
MYEERRVEVVDPREADQRFWSRMDAHERLNRDRRREWNVRRSWEMGNMVSLKSTAKSAARAKAKAEHGNQDAP